MRIFTALLTLIFSSLLSFAQPPNETPFQQSSKTVIVKIQDRNVRPDGVSTLRFLAGTTLSNAPFPELISYEGEWKAGVAHGSGFLRFADTPPLYVPPDTTPIPLRNYYFGKFVDGVPSGDGELVSTQNTSQVHTISGIFTDSQVVFSVNGQTRAVLTRAGPGENGLVRLMQYPNLSARLPSRIFFGSNAEGNLKGEWIDVPWYQADETRILVGYGPYTEAGEDGKAGSYSCKFNDWSIAQPPTLDAFLGNQGITPQYIAGLDLRFRGKASCIATSEEGWTWLSEDDYGSFLFKRTVLSCRTPDGKQGSLGADYYCTEKSSKKQDLFTNIGREFKKFLDRRIIGTINKIGGSSEKAMCRASGTEPGVNCNVNMSVGASWPIGDEPATNLPAEQEAARQSLIAASKRASKLREDIDGKVGEVAAVTGELNAVCIALCTTKSQQQFSAALLSELERAAKLPDGELKVKTIGTISRETASVLSAGIKALTIGAILAKPSIAFYKFIQSAKQEARFSLAIDSVNSRPLSADPLGDMKKRTEALQTLHALHFAHLNRMVAEGATLLGESITLKIKVLGGLPPQRVRALSLAIALGKTKKQVEDFVEKYKDVQNEDQLYDAIITEALAPLGISWPPSQ